MKGMIKQSFKRQIFVIFLAVTLALVIIGGILTIQGFLTKLSSDYEKRDLEQAEVIQKMLEKDLRMSEEALEKLADSRVIRSVLENDYSNSLDIYTALYDASREIKEFAGVGIYKGGKCLYSTLTDVSNKELPQNYSVLGEAVAKKGQTVYSLDPRSSTETGSALLMARQVTEGEENGFVVIRIEQNKIKERLSKVINSKDGLMVTGTFLRPICLLGTAEDGDELSIIRRNFFAGQRYTYGIDNNVYMTELGDTGLISIYVTPPALGEGAARVGYQIVVILAVTSILVCLFVANRMSEYFAKPIGVLSSAMKRFRKGDFDAKIELDRDDEFQQLASGFNKMTTQLKTTMEERVEAERRVNETRIKMMQAQLNPHFLYNTLDTIKWVAKAHGVNEVATLSSSLAGILRTGISEKQFCKLSNELELVQNYCDIQKIRFDDKFDITIDVPEDVTEAVIPKLILQPIVENAIIHGMEDMDDGHIYVAAVHDTTKGNDLLKISVQDNGKGISDEMLNALNNDDVETLKGHLGLNNVNTIIRLYYGKEYGVMAFRPSEGGTVMIVTLPYSEEQPGT